MQLARVHGPGDVRLDDVPVPACGRGEALAVAAMVRAPKVMLTFPEHA